MATLNTSVSLQDELEHLAQIIRPGEKFTCFGKTLRGKKCCNPLGQERRAKLERLLNVILGVLANFGNDLVHLLEKTSSLVMCATHQSQASEKLNEWIRIIPAENTDVQHDDDQVGFPYSLNTFFLCGAECVWIDTI
jgi:hypothetical protein